MFGKSIFFAWSSILALSTATTPEAPDGPDAGLRSVRSFPDQRPEVADRFGAALADLVEYLATDDSKAAPGDAALRGSAELPTSASLVPAVGEDQKHLVKQMHKVVEVDLVSDDLTPLLLKEGAGVKDTANAGTGRPRDCPSPPAGGYKYQTSDRCRAGNLVVEHIPISTYEMTYVDNYWRHSHTFWTCSGSNESTTIRGAYPGYYVYYARNQGGRICWYFI